MDVKLTKKTDQAFCAIYNEYLKRIDSGKSKDEAIEFGAIFELQSTILPEWFEEDINAALSELSDCGFIHMYVDSSFELLNTAILYMERRFPDGLKELFSIVAPFLP